MPRRRVWRVAERLFSTRPGSVPPPRPGQNPRADLGPAGGLRGRRATRPVDPVDDCTLDASSEETADGDPQMAECLWRSALSRGPAAMAGTIVARYNAFSPV